MADDVRLFTTVGTGFTLAPPGAPYNCIIIEMWGGGGGGQVTSAQEGSGGGGGYCIHFQPIIGSLWYYDVGGGGAPGAAGGTTYFGDQPTYAASGMAMQVSGGGAGAGSAAAGGFATVKVYNIGAFKGFNGGNGAAPQGGSGTRGGSGGGGTGGPAGASQNGGAGSGGAGGIGGAGNNGVAPQSSSAASGAVGAAGSSHVDGGGGGGGGGGGATGTGGAGGVPGGGAGGGGSSANAGTGARGQLRITFTVRTIGYPQPTTVPGATASAGTVTVQVSPTVLNALDKKNASVALSNGNRTVTGNDAGGNNWVRSTNPRTGKRYVEFTTTTVANTVIGIADLSAMTYPGFDAKSFGLYNNGSGGIAATFPAWGPTYASGNVLGMAVDLTANKVWYRVNGGAWNAGGSADPATGVGGWDISLYTGDPDYLVVSSGQTAVTTVNFGNAAFQTTQPSGYLAWDGQPNSSVTVTGAAATTGAGTVTATGQRNVSTTVTGAQAAASAGTVTVTITVPGISVNVTGAQATTGAGTVTTTTNTVPWTPASIGTDLIAWYDFADAATVIQSGGFLTQWRDKSGNARHGNAMSAGTLAVNADGIYIANATAGANLAIQMPALPSAYFDFAFAGKPNPAGSYRTLMAQALGGQHHILIETGTNNLGNYSNAWFQAGSLTWPAVDSQVYFVGPGASTIKIGRDGAAPIDLVGENFVPDNAPCLLNYSVNGAQGFGTAREFVFMTASMAQAVQEKVSGYLAWKWDGILGGTTHVSALPSGHPYKSGPPMVVSGISVPVTGAQAAASAGTVGFRGNVSTTITGAQALANPGTVTFRGNVRPTVVGDFATTGVGTATVTIPGTGRTKVWTGSAWALKPAKVWNGSAWVPKPAKVWNGSAWV